MSRMTGEGRMDNSNDADEWLSLLRSVIARSEMLATDAQIAMAVDPSAQKLPAFAALARAFSLLRATELLLNERLITEARTMVRSLFECTFLLGALKQK